MAEEDNVLLSLHAEWGTAWSKISKQLPGRTAQQCRARFFQLKSYDDGRTKVAPRTKAHRRDFSTGKVSRYGRAGAADSIGFAVLFETFLPVMVAIFAFFLRERAEIRHMEGFCTRI